MADPENDIVPEVNAVDADKQGASFVKNTLIPACCFFGFFGCLIGAMMWFTWIGPGTSECDRAYHYESVERWMDSENAEHFYPLLKKAMEDGVLTGWEWDEMDELDDDLELLKDKSAFLDMWDKNKDRWAKGDFRTKNQIADAAQAEALKNAENEDPAA